MSDTLPDIPQVAPEPIVFDSREDAARGIDQLNQRITSIITENGAAMLLDPDGIPVQVPEGQAPDLLAQGYAPEDEVQYNRRLKTESLQRIADPATTFMRRGLSGFTFGLSDLALKQSMGEDTMAELQQIEDEQNPIAGALGTTAGIISSAVTPGGLLGTIGKGAAKVGGKTAFGAASKLGPLAKPGLMRGLGKATQHGIEGGAIGLGQAISQYGHGHEFDPGAVATGALASAGLGAAFSGVAAIASRASGSTSSIKQAIEHGMGGSSLFNQMLTAVKSPTARWAAAGYSVGGPLGAVVGAAGTKQLERVVRYMVPKLSAAGSRASGALRRAGATDHARFVGAKFLSEREYEALRDKLSDEGLAKFEHQMRSEEQPRAIAFGLDPEAVETAMQLKLQTMDFLREKLPQSRKTYPAGDVRSLQERPYVPTPEERYRFGKYATTALMPSALVDQIANGTLTPESVEVWRRFYPDALKQLQNLVKQGIEQSGHGGEFTADQVRTFNTLFEVPADQSYIKLLQSNYAQGGQKPSSGRGPSAPQQLAGAYETRIQSALKGQ